MDEGLQQFDRFKADIAHYLSDHFSETDTRVKFIDPLLTQVLGWKELVHIRREENFQNEESRRCIDYVLSLNGPVLVVEAKRNLVNFEIPKDTGRVSYKLSGVMQTWKNAWAAVLQARQYCDSIGARYALVTNGRQYIAFKAISEHGPWLDGSALVLGSLDDVRAHFSVFYQCLSKELIVQDRLAGFSVATDARHYRAKPRSSLQTPNTGFRNTLHDVLHRAFREALLDVPNPSVEFLEQCYCTNNDVLKFGRQLDSLLVDPIPDFKQPIGAVRPGDKKDQFDRTVKSLRRSGDNPLVVVMGGTGVGKTTFLKWYFHVHLSRAERQVSVVATCDFREIECEPSEIHSRVVREVVRRVKLATSDITGGFEQLKEVFKSQIRDALRGTLKPYADDSNERERRVAQLIEELQTEDEAHLACLVDYLHDTCNKQVLIVLDNMDQKADLFQEKLYHTAQAVVHSCRAAVMLVLREATYQRLMRLPQFNAFTSIDLHVKAQPLSTILEKRLAYLAGQLPSNEVSLESSSGVTLAVQDVNQFLQLMTRSLLPTDKDSEATECVSAVSNGNVRLQLQMVYSFLVSGQTKVDEYFWFYAKSDARTVPFHEFLHSIILEDCRVFVELNGRAFMNVFEPSNSRVASHFTVLRILDLFRTKYGQTGLLRSSDFVSVATIHAEFQDQGTTLSELGFYLKRMAEFGLLMPQGLEASHGFGSEPFALTKCGLYYLERLYKNPTYFSLMAHDTTLFDQTTCERCSELLKRFSGEPKLPLVTRNEIAGCFLKYLDQKENTERNGGVVGRHAVFGAVTFVPPMEVALERVVRMAN